jgi:four helix bundle protein
MGTFEDLRAFQRAMDLMVDVYKATETFPKQELYGLTSQLRRAACSIVSNIAEGQGRITYGERRQMFSHARGSLFEVQAQVIASQRLNFLTESAAGQLKKRIAAAGRELAGLIEWVEKRESENKRRRTRSSQTPDT